MPDEMSSTDKLKAQMRAFSNPDASDATQIDKESEKALAKVKSKARQFEVDTVNEFKQKRVKKLGTKRITVDVPEDLHSEFKMLVIKIGTDMNAFLLRVIEKSVESENRS